MSRIGRRGIKIGRPDERRPLCLLDDRSQRCRQTDPSEGDAGPPPIGGRNGCLDAGTLGGSEDACSAAGERRVSGDVARALRFHHRLDVWGTRVAATSPLSGARLPRI